MRERTKEIDFHKVLNGNERVQSSLYGQRSSNNVNWSHRCYKVLAECTSKKHLLDVCINKHFKSILRECWDDYVVKVVKDTADKAIQI